MESVIVAALIAAIVSMVVSKAITAHHFKVIDSYVRDVIDLAKEQIRKAYSSQDRR